MAHPQPESTDDIARYAPLYLDAFLERYGFTLASREPLRGQGRWLEHDSCGWSFWCASNVPVRVIFNLAAGHLSRECEQQDHQQ